MVPVDPAAKVDAPMDVLLRDGRVAEVAAPNKTRGSADEKFDARGLVVAPGFIGTPAAAYLLSNPESRAAMGQMVPLSGAYPGRPEQMAAIIAWCLSEENSLMTGQILFVDGGVECTQRGERSW